MKRTLITAASGVLLLFLLPMGAFARKVLIPCGNAVGLHLKDDTITVAAFDDAMGTAARDAGLEIGDQLVQIQGRSVTDAEDVQKILQEFQGEVTLTVARGGRRKEIQVEPVAGRLGIYLRQGVTGIGTVTWYDPDSGRFGALGHGVSSPQGMLLNLSEGNIYRAHISCAVSGKSGHPGLLKGNADKSSKLGALYRNSPQGVFGKARGNFHGEALPAAAFSEIHTGAASIRSTVSGADPQEYSVEILKIYPETREDCRNFLLRVTDPELLSLTGGIVQGMSGSPILQDGRIIGAVTHVMVSDPTTGYGIFIGNMLNAAA